MHRKAYLAGGCFWGMEDLFRDLQGVVDTEAGYTGGKNDNPTYENHPGHAEALEITYDPGIISYKQLLDFFFQIHNPTTLNRQGMTSVRHIVPRFFTRTKQKKGRQRNSLGL